MSEANRGICGELGSAVQPGPHRSLRSDPTAPRSGCQLKRLASAGMESNQAGNFPAPGVCHTFGRSAFEVPADFIEVLVEIGVDEVPTRAWREAYFTTVDHHDLTPGLFGEKCRRVDHE